MENSFAPLFLLPVIIHLVVVLGAWLYYDNRRSEADARGGEGKIYRCEKCNLVYVERRHYPVLECPRCKHPNAAIRR